MRYLFCLCCSVCILDETQRSWWIRLTLKWLEALKMRIVFSYFASRSLGHKYLICTDVVVILRFKEMSVLNFHLYGNCRFCHLHVTNVCVPCSSYRTWRSSWMRRKLQDKNCSWTKWPLSRRSRKWRRTFCCWRTKTPSFSRWGNFSWKWRFKQNPESRGSSLRWNH